MNEFEFKNIVFETEDEASNVLDVMLQILDIYDLVLVADLYDISGMPGSYIDIRYGWTKLNNIGITKVENGYIIDLPKPIPVR